MAKRKPPKIGKGSKLTMAQELFCYFFTGLYFNNAVRSYAAAYNINLDEYDRLSKLISAYDGKAPVNIVQLFEAQQQKYSIASSAGQENLTKPLIQKRIQEHLIEKFNDLDAVDAQHSKVIFQDADLPSKMRAIAEFNKLKGRVTDKHEIKGTFSLTELLKEADEA